jgi:hypothetical protein
MKAKTTKAVPYLQAPATVSSITAASSFAVTLAVTASGANKKQPRKRNEGFWPHESKGPRSKTASDVVVPKNIDLSPGTRPGSAEVKIMNLTAACGGAIMCLACRKEESVYERDPCLAKFERGYGPTCCYGPNDERATMCRL